MRDRVVIGLLALALVLVGVAAWLYAPDRQRAGLEAAYAQPPSRFVDVLGLRVHVRVTGPAGAPAVVLLHGFGSSLQTWDAWAAALEADRRVIRYDLPGFGLTGAEPSGDYSDARSVAVLLELMDRLGVARASLVGNSMGGRYAWLAAALHPERVERLVLVSPDGFASPGREYGAKPEVPAMMRVLPYVLPAPLLRASLRPAYADPAVLTEPLFVRYRDMMLAPGVRRAIVDRMGQDVRVDPVPLLRRIVAPTLLLWGEQDAMIPVSNALDYERAIPGARVERLPGVGHVPQEEAPGSVALVRAFLAGAP